MRLALDVSALDRPWATGVEKALLQLLTGLSRTDEDFQCLLVAPNRPRLLPETRDSRFEAHWLGAPAATRWWRERCAPRFVRESGAQLWHSPVQAIPLRLNCPTVATMHELSWLETHGVSDEGPIWLRRLRARAVAARASRIVCVSERTRRNFVHLQPAAEGKSVVIHHAVDPIFSAAEPAPELLHRAYGLPHDKPWLLTVGRALYRKGLPRAVEVFAHFVRETGAPHDLVLAGPINESLREAAGRADDFGCSERIHLPGYIDQRHLPALYATAAALLFPSTSEGFGLPPLEAMAAGTPVIANPAASIPEVVGDAALLVDFEQAEQTVSVIGTAVGPERDEWVRRGRARAADFPFEQPARRHLALWRELLG